MRTTQDRGGWLSLGRPSVSNASLNLNTSLIISWNDPDTAADRLISVNQASLLSSTVKKPLCYRRRIIKPWIATEVLRFMILRKNAIEDEKLTIKCNIVTIKISIRTQKGNFRETR